MFAKTNLNAIVDGKKNTVVITTESEVVLSRKSKLKPSGSESWKTFMVDLEGEENSYT